MRTTREVLRLRFDAKLSYSKIATSCHISSSTAMDVIRRFRLSGLPWPLASHLDDGLLDKMLYRDKHPGAPPDPHVPDWNWVHSELRKHKHVTLQVLWEEYKLEHPKGYNYSWFCQCYSAHRSKLDPVMRQIHKAGEKCFVDYAGPTVPIIDARTGEVRSAAIFVGILGASNYTFAEATWSQDLPNWLGSHVRMYRFFGGVPEITVPDNLKSGVKKPDRYEPDVNPAYNDLATQLWDGRHSHARASPSRQSQGGKCGPGG
jgi:transposase